MLLLHDNTRPHSSVYTTEAITEDEWTVFLHLPYSPEHMLSDFHLFGPLKGMPFFPRWKESVDKCVDYV